MDANVTGKLLEEEKGAQGWGTDGQMMGGLDTKQEVVLVARVRRTQLLGQFCWGIIREDEFYNL